MQICKKSKGLSPPFTKYVSQIPGVLLLNKSIVLRSNVFLIIMVLCVVYAFGQEEGPINDGVGYSNSISKIIIDASGTLHAIWNEDYSIKYARKPNGGNWSEEKAVLERYLAQYTSSPSIGIDAAGNVQALWLDGREIGAGGGIYSSSYDNSSGTCGTNLRANDSVDRVGFYPALAVDSSGNAYAIWHETCDFAAQITGSHPSLHWDIHLNELLTSMNAYTWKLHVGASFTDVSIGSIFYKYIETLLHNEVTGGCAGSYYCPLQSVTCFSPNPLYIIR
ncbi:MAG: hypothetical protein A2Y62_09140 [Candidatus Fischerbacteria bacterium RBG_13_37_8]|uniref:Uncharacterized protein n=1 Tax=Candidatus Fischerbacteria bacterium RBG_13_37_8 TaxID=1817863 RepID=A0A1F5VW00_9BACT|nr:MAG: hypothetical protein A2Y62_09140 [Candidatus Fischerbacteria bacterium RBG_13_37_8]